MSKLHDLMYESRNLTIEAMAETEDERGILRQYHDYERMVWDRQHSAKEVVPFPTYSDDPRWPSDYEALLVEHKRITDEMEDLGNTRTALWYLRSPGWAWSGDWPPPVKYQYDDTKLYEQYSKLWEQQRALDKRVSAFERTGSRVKKVRMELYAKYTQRQHDAAIDVHDALWNAPQGVRIARAYNQLCDVLEQRRAVKLTDLVARIHAAIKELP